MSNVILHASKWFSIVIVTNLVATNFQHPDDVVTKMKKSFRDMKSFKSSFKISINENKHKKVSTGTAYYKNGGRLNFSFSSGDKIISNGKKMWVYVASLRAVGEQDLNYKKNGKSIYQTTSYEGLVSLFRRYHYRFNNIDQPQTLGGRKFYILLLNEKTASGGFSHMKLFINPETYIISRIEAKSESGRKVTLEYNNIKRNLDLPSKLFTFKKRDNIKVIKNPLTTE